MDCEGSRNATNDLALALRRNWNMDFQNMVGFNGVHFTPTAPIQTKTYSLVVWELFALAFDTLDNE